MAFGQTAFDVSLLIHQAKLNDAVAKELTATHNASPPSQHDVQPMRANDATPDDSTHQVTRSLAVLVGSQYEIRDMLVTLAVDPQSHDRRQVLD